MFLQTDIKSRYKNCKKYFSGVSRFLLWFISPSRHPHPHLQQQKEEEEEGRRRKDKT